MAPDIEPAAKKIKWYHKTPIVLIAILGFGPFAIPLIWMSPSLKKQQKTLLTVLTALFTLWMVKCSVDLYRVLLKEMQDLQAALN